MTADFAARLNAATNDGAIPIDALPVPALRVLAKHTDDAGGYSKMKKAQLIELVTDYARHLATTPTADDGPVDGCPACAASNPTAPLPLSDEVVHGLTTYGHFGGAQIRIESGLIDPDAGNLAPPEGCLYVAFGAGAIRSNEDGNPYRLDLTDARRLRDLLNIATARGAI